VAKVLVTGSGGFVGRILIPQLADAGYDVWGVDREASDEARRIACDLCNRSAVNDLLERVQPRHIVHLAAQSSAGRSFDEPHETIQNNLLPVLHLLEYLREAGRGVRLLAVGSADAYGSVTADQLPLRETTAPNPGNPYALSKVMQEDCCRLYAALYGVDVVMTRSFNHTGAGQLDRFVLPSFARQIVEISRGLRGVTVQVGNIDVRRDFSDVRDVCGAYLALLEAGRAGEIYNVCSGRSFSLRELLEKLAALQGVTIEIEIDAARVRKVDMEELRGDNRKIEADTGWQPTTSIDETLRSLLEFWSSRVG